MTVQCGAGRAKAAGWSQIVFLAVKLHGVWVEWGGVGWGTEMELLNWDGATRQAGQKDRDNQGGGRVSHACLRVFSQWEEIDPGKELSKHP